MAILQVQHIEKSFGATPVLRDISFSISAARPGLNSSVIKDHPVI